MDPASPELVALLAACRARPADDLPRLVLADWLDENGDPERAEFVRVQVELSHPTADAKRTADLRGRESKLLGDNAETWIGGYRKAQTEMGPQVRAFDYYRQHGRYPPPPPAPCFTRGLLSIANATDLLDRGELHSWLRSPEAAWLERFDLTYPWVDSFVKAELPDELHGRIDLTLNMSGTEDETTLRRQFRQLAVSGNFAAVRSLCVHNTSAQPLIEELTRATVDHLCVLRLPVRSDDETRLGTVVRIAEMMASVPFTALSSLDIGPLPEPALRALIRSPHLGNLVHLNLIGGRYGSPIGDAGMVALCGSKLAHTLRAVEFPNTGIGDVGAVALARSPLFAHLHGPRLNLMMNRIGDVGLTALADSEHLLRFSELVLRENQVGDEGVIALAESPYSANLRFLDFWRNRITDRGAFALARSPHLNSVVDLSVKENAVTAAGAAALHERFGEAAKV
ncbi:MAG: TIGR02996 domain-containing protein [Gemmataceae bacterium]